MKPHNIACLISKAQSFGKFVYRISQKIIKYLEYRTSMGEGSKANNVSYVLHKNQIY